MDNQKFHKYEIDEKFFDKIDSEHKAYFLGFLYADGYNHEKRTIIAISLQEDDIDILEKLKNTIGSTRPLKSIKRSGGNRKNQYRLTITNSHLSKQLSILGCYQKKSLTLKFPTPEQVPENLIRHFIRGYFDGDGCIGYRKKNDRPNTWELSLEITSSKTFCEKLHIKLKSEYNISSVIKTTRNKNKKYTRTLRIKGGKIKLIEFLDFIYKNSTISLNRKYNKYLEVKEKIKI